MLGLVVLWGLASAYRRWSDKSDWDSWVCAIWTYLGILVVLNIILFVI